MVIPGLVKESAAPRVYLAGPSVFRTDAKEYGEHLKKVAGKLGLNGEYPLDNKITFTGNKFDDGM
ncbi:MAG: nucleoside 2-deoxyribosyltransferase, partial [Candidatus Thorarchaeota archaeon]